MAIRRRLTGTSEGVLLKTCCEGHSSMAQFVFGPKLTIPLTWYRPYIRPSGEFRKRGHRNGVASVSCFLFSRFLVFFLLSSFFFCLFHFFPFFPFLSFFRLLSVVFLLFRFRFHFSIVPFLPFFRFFPFSSVFFLSPVFPRLVFRKQKRQQEGRHRSCLTNPFAKPQPSARNRRKVDKYLDVGLNNGNMMALKSHF